VNEPTYQFSRAMAIEPAPHCHVCDSIAMCSIADSKIGWSARRANGISKPAITPSAAPYGWTPGPLQKIWGGSTRITTLTPTWSIPTRSSPVLSWLIA
jgi:hypothetical protein